MKNRVKRLLLCGCLMIGMTVPAFAETLPTATDWHVTFTADKRMESNFGKNNMNDVISGMQPGDDVTFQITLNNNYNDATDWYMENKVLSSLEDSVRNANGGAYTYRLTYSNDGVAQTLFDSDTVGGDTVTEAGQGLNQATNGLEDYFFLDKLASGENGAITLYVALDGETQGNTYQDTLADLTMNFAVELSKTEQTPEEPEDPSDPDVPSTPKTPSTSTPSDPGTHVKPVYTGDDSNLFVYFAAAGAAGLVLLLLAIASLRKDNAR